jgi:hypothetical protein
MMLTRIHQAPDQLLHIGSPRSALSGGSLSRHVVRLNDNSAAGESGAELLDDAHDAE